MLGMCKQEESFMFFTMSYGLKRSGYMNRRLLTLLLVVILSACGDENLSTNAVAAVSGDCPSTHPIKGNKSEDSDWIYHKPNSQYYKKTNAEECFSNETDAQNAGYRKPRR